MACTIGSIFPDIDIFAGELARNPLAIMEWHRNITHSLVLLPVWALLLAATVFAACALAALEAAVVPALAVIYAAGLATHVFLDVVTNFGTMVWSPLKYSRLAWDWIFILDLTLTAFALVPQLARVVLPGTAKICSPAAAIWVALTAGGFRRLRAGGTAGYGFPIGVVGVVSVGVCAVVLVRASRQGRGFPLAQSKLVPRGLALACVYLACAAVMHRKALADVDHLLRLKSSGRRKSRRASSAANTYTLGRVISTPEGVWRTTFHVPGGASNTCSFIPMRSPIPTWKKQKGCAMFRSIFGSRDFRFGR